MSVCNKSRFVYFGGSWTLLINAFGVKPGKSALVGTMVDLHHLDYGYTDVHWLVLMGHL